MKESEMNVWWCADGKYAELEQIEVCEVHVAGGLACGPMRLVPADALIVEKVDGEWPKKARQKVASALGEAVGHERRNTLTVETFVGIGDFLLDNLASDIDLNVERIKDAQASQVGESGR